VLGLGGSLIVASNTAGAATTLTVTTTADIPLNAGACGDVSITTPAAPLSLREATCVANNLGGAVTITIPAGVFQLANGELTPGIASGQAITLNGAGPASTTIDAQGLSRVFDIDSTLVGGVTVNLSGMTVTRGDDSTFGGAGIIAGSADQTTADILSIDNTVVTGNHANVADPTASNKPGGGIQFIGGKLTITNSTISNNSSSSSSGSGLAYSGTGAATPEGLTITNTTFSGNQSTNSEPSGVLANGGALSLRGTATTNVDITGSRFAGNSVNATTGPAMGGAIWSQGGVLNVTGSTFTGNSAGGGPGSPSGAAIAVSGGSAALHYNRFAGNIATAGSALAVSATGAATATDNWWGCNTGPGAAGCDTVSGGPTISPRLVLTAVAAPSTVTGPNATSTISAALTTDSLGSAVGAANLGAFDGLQVSWSLPDGNSGTVDAPSSVLAAGQASIPFRSHAVSGVTHVVAALDNASTTVTVTVNRVPAITSSASVALTLGVLANFTVATTGFPTAAISTSSTLPSGLALVDQGNGTALLAGTPLPGAQGSHVLVITASNGVNPAAVQNLTVNIGAAPAFTSGLSATFVAGTAGSFDVTTSGTPTVTSIVPSLGTLPSGLSFTDNGNGTATVSGTPAAGTGGSSTIVLTATNGITPNAVQTLTILVNEAPTVSTDPADQTVNPGASVSFLAAAAGAPLPSVQWQRSTNGGGTFSDITGATSPTYTFTAAGADSGNRYRAVFTNLVSTVMTTAATLTVGSVPDISSANTATFTVGTAGSFDVTTTGFPSPATTIDATTPVPSWLHLTDNGDGTATLAGTPPAGSGGLIPFTIKAINGFSPSASQAFTLQVDEAPTFTSADHATFTVGTAGSFAVIASPGFPAATAFTIAPALPAGLSLADQGNGTALLQGTPTAGDGGSHVFTITATATASTAAPATQAFTLTIDESPTVTSADHATFTVGTAGTFTLTTSGSYPLNPALSMTALVPSTLPSGVSFVDNHNGTATLSGTPAASSGGSYSLRLTATPAGTAAATVQAFTLTVNEPPRITSANHATFVVGAAASFTVTTSPGQPAGPPTISTSPVSLPPGLTLTDNADGTATIAGTPTAGGVFGFVIVASNGVLPDAAQSFTATVQQAPTITSADHSTFTAGTAGSFTVTTTAATPAAVTLSETGGLPTGVTFSDNGDGTATISGTPAAGQGGRYPITLTASNGVSPNGTQVFTLTVNELAAFTSAAATHVTAGSALAFDITTQAAFPTATTVSETGTLPTGVSFAAGSGGTGTLSGTPAPGTGGSYPLTLTATNLAGARQQAFTLTVDESPVITSPNATTFTAGTAGSFTVTTSAGFPVATTISATGALPAGVTFTPHTDGTATLAGTPGAGGSFPLTIMADNGASPQASQSFLLTVNGPPSITSAGTMTFTAGVAGTFTFTARAGVPAATTLSESGALPPGVSFSDNGDGTATMAGTAPANAVGSYPLTITASNGTLPDASQAFVLKVALASVVDLPGSVPASNGLLAGVPARTSVGQVLHLSGHGFAAGAPIVLGVYSKPTKLGTAVADSSGGFSATITVPALTGKHTFVAAGTGSNGRARFLTVATVIRPAAVPVTTTPTPAVASTSASPSVGLASTGPSTDPRTTAGLAVVILLAGFAMVGLSRRRRRSSGR
jgi:hypothetical protein